MTHQTPPFHPLLVLAAQCSDPIQRANLQNQARRQILQTQILNCSSCDLRFRCRQPVPWTGPTPCNIAFIAEAPGPTENKTGVPLDPSAPAGRHFAELLAGIGLRREHVAILNRNNCFPGYTSGKNPKIIAPTPEQMAACAPNLEAQLALIDPAVCVWMGESAVSHIWTNLPKTGRVEKARKASPVTINGRTHIATWHPAKLCYEPGKRGEMQVDFAKAGRALHDVAVDRVQGLFPTAEFMAQQSYEEVCHYTADIFRQLLLKMPHSMRTVTFYQLIGRVLAGKSNPHHLRALYDAAFAGMCGVVPDFGPPMTEEEVLSRELDTLGISQGVA